MQHPLIEYLKIYTENEKLLKIITTISNKDPNSKEYEKIVERIYYNFLEAKIFLKEEYPLLEKLETSISTEKNYIANLGFKKLIINTLLNKDLYQYLEYITEKLNLDWNQVNYLGSGSSNYAFSLNDKVIKLGNQRMTFNFPYFFRLNKLIIQKKFSLKDKTLYLEVSPKGEKTILTNEDKENIKNDFNKAGIILGDPNISDNFMLFKEEYEPNFTDIEGLHDQIDIEESTSYQKRKLKLIDLDYIYPNNSEKIIYAPKL